MHKETTGLRLVFRALRYRNYRLFFGGQGISLIGTWMQRIALSWLVYRLTNSALLLGVVGFAGQIPTFLLAPVAGVLADRWNCRRILVITQVLAMVQAFVLAVLVLTNAITVWEIVVLSIFLGLVNAFDMPARQTFVVEMVDRKKEDLGNAIALNSSLFNGARLVGPSVAGILIAVVGEGVCFLLNGLSYIAVIGSLLAMRVTPRKTEAKNTHVLRGLKDGFSYAFGFDPIRSIILLLALVSLMGMPYQILMPVFARQILHGGSNIFGFLVAASGAGALTGAFYLASRRQILRLGRTIPVAAGIFGVGLIGFSLSHFLWLSLALMLVTGFGMMVMMAASNTTLQTIVDDDKRGRVMSLYTMAFMGTVPFGSLWAGSMADKIGAPKTLLVSGLCCICGGLLFARKLPVLKALVHPIYAEKGIIPEVAYGIQTTDALTKPPEA
ncbi:MAG: MFS transporter [Candidatus Eisenbacteria bacterium]|nr:MFS transporter [Candidatus Eisenbacteria bacterium]